MYLMHSGTLNLGFQSFESCNTVSLSNVLRKLATGAQVCELGVHLWYDEVAGSYRHQVAI